MAQVLEMGVGGTIKQKKKKTNQTPSITVTPKTNKIPIGNQVGLNSQQVQGGSQSSNRLGLYNGSPIMPIYKPNPDTKISFTQDKPNPADTSYGPTSQQVQDGVGGTTKPIMNPDTKAGISTNPDKVGLRQYVESQGGTVGYDSKTGSITVNGVKVNPNDMVNGKAYANASELDKILNKTPINTNQVPSIYGNKPMTTQPINNIYKPNPDTKAGINTNVKLNHSDPYKSQTYRPNPDTKAGINTNAGLNKTSQSMTGINTNPNVNPQQAITTGTQPVFTPTDKPAILDAPQVDTNVTVQNPTDIMAQLLSMLNQNKDNVGISQNSTPIVPPNLPNYNPMSFNQALSQANSQLNPLYQQALKNIMNQDWQNRLNADQTANARGGLHSGLAADLLNKVGIGTQNNRAQLAADNASQAAQMATALVNRDQDMQRQLLNDAFSRWATTQGLNQNQQQFDWNKLMDQSGLTGYFNGQPTAQYQNQIFNQAMVQNQFDYGKQQDTIQNQFKQAQLDQAAKQFATQMGYNYDRLNQDEQQFLKQYATQQQNQANQQQEDQAKQTQQNVANYQNYLDNLDYGQASPDAKLQYIQMLEQNGIPSSIIDQLLIQNGFSTGR